MASGFWGFLGCQTLLDVGYVVSGSQELQVGLAEAPQR